MFIDNPTKNDLEMNGFIKRKSISYVVASEILHRTGRFTAADILNSLLNNPEADFSDIEYPAAYVQDKLATLNSLGLINATDAYYYN